MKIAVALLILGCVGSLVYFSYENTRRSEGFSELQKGMSRAEIEVLLGSPDSVNTCLNEPSWEGDPVGGHCAAELRYNQHFASSFWTIGLDEGGNVMAKYHYVSP